MRQLTVNEYLKKRYGRKIYKIAINAGFTCPNRDGTLGTNGCIFCSGSGSGDFAEDPVLSVTEQIEQGKKRVGGKVPADAKFIAYFQAFTNTYAPVDKLRKLYMEAVDHPDIVLISIATRPDCLGTDMIELLKEINGIKPVWVELGLQTIHEKTAEWMRRGYALSVFDEAVRRLAGISGHLGVIVHVIMDLPGEDEEMMLQTIGHLNELPVHGVKIANLNILKDTDLAGAYQKDPFPLMEMDEYIGLLEKIIRRLRPDIVVYRMTGDGAKRTLIAPLWVGNKRLVRNSIEASFRLHDVQQGANYIPKRA
jgi:radical SAM protein (TIGR01212 family)